MSLPQPAERGQIAEWTCDGRYQFPTLTREAVDGRMQEVLERDWYELAKVTLAKRLAGEEDPEQHGQDFML